MIIDVRPILAALPVVAILWLAIIAGLMRLTGDAPAALVIWPSAGMLAALPAGAAVVSTGPVSVTVRGDAGLVAALYAAGAVLVLPAGLTGCLPQGN